MKGIWINENTFLKFTETRNLTLELAVRQRSLDYISNGLYLPNPDPILKKQGKDIKIYRELLTDAHLSGCISSRKSGITSLEWDIDRGSAKTRQAKLITDLFKNIEIYEIIYSLLDAIYYGYSVLEIIWEKVGSLILPSKILSKPQEWFLFDEKNELKIRTKDNINGEPLPEYKFIVAQHNPSYNNPYGESIASKCFWPVTFKKGGLKFWAIFTEKYGMPYLIGKHPRGTSQEDTNKLADLLENMVQDAIAVIPDDSSVEILDTTGKSGSAEIYKELINYCDNQISIAILGQNLTTQVSGGSYAAAQAHMEIRKDIINADKRFVEKYINKLIKWVYELNFNDAEHPKFILYEEEDVDRDLAERDEKLVSSLQLAGLKLTKRYFQKYYALEDEDIEETNLPPTKEYSESPHPKPHTPYPDQTAIDKTIESLSPEKLQSQMEDVLKPIIELIQKGNSYEEVMEKLLETYPNMDQSEIEQMLTKAIFISEIWGRLNAN